MKNELKQVYFCDFCKKHGLSASSISRHEKYCPSNPINKHKCFDHCRYLRRDRFVFEGYSKTAFTCLKNGNKMYSFILEKKASIWPHHIKFDGLKRMPLECNEFIQMDYDQINERYNLEYND